jgi:hypothetical protein
MLFGAEFNVRKAKKVPKFRAVRLCTPASASVRSRLASAEPISFQPRRYAIHRDLFARSPNIAGTAGARLRLSLH